MICQSVESMIADSARERFSGATVEKDVLAHASECERCRARLAGERALDSGLRAFAEMLYSRQDAKRSPPLPRT